MANYSRWDDVKNRRRAPDTETRAGGEHDLALGQLVYDLRTEAGLSQRELAERMGTTQSVISRLEEGGDRATASTPSPGSPPRSTGTSSCRSPNRSRPGSRTPCVSPEQPAAVADPGRWPYSGRTHGEELRMSATRLRRERLEVRTTRDERALIDRAVAEQGTDLTEFVISNLTVAARRVLADRTEFALDAEAVGAWEAVNRRRARDLPGLRRLMERTSPFTAE